MSSRREKARGKLMAEAEALIDELLEWGDGVSEPDLSQIEEKVLDLRRRFGEQLALAVIDGQEAKLPVPGPRCPKCQREMECKGLKGNTVESWVGRLWLERGYYYCLTCREGLFPPGSTA